MPKHYVYRLDHDTGFAPNIEYRICTLSGCKKTTIERWAERGSWVIGIGGNNTGKPVSEEMGISLGISGSIQRSIPPRFIRNEKNINNLKYILGL